MKLTLDRMDMLPEFRATRISGTKFEHLSESAQAAVVAVGRATIYEWGGDNYNMIYPPKRTSIPTWHQMETAPTDGRMVLVSSAIHVHVAAYLEPPLVQSGNWYDLQWTDNEGAVKISKPVAWMPWPEPAYNLSPKEEPNE